MRWVAAEPDRIGRYAAELAALAPDVIVATGSATIGPLQRVTRSVPIVFVSTVDPVGGGFVESLARPGTNATGFTAFAYGMSGKWLELLKEIAPPVTRVAVLRDREISSGTGQFGAIQSVAPSCGVELRPIGSRDVGEIERAIMTFARSANGGLIVTPSALTLVLRASIIELAARHKLPAIYPNRHFVTAGGLTDLTSSSSTGKRLATWIEFSRERSQPIFRRSRQPSTRSLSTSKPRRRSVSPSRLPCSRVRMRRSSSLE